MIYSNIPVIGGGGADRTANFVQHGETMKLKREEKLNLMRALNWDYDVSPEDMLDVIEEKRESAGAFDRDILFIRSLERLNWYDILGLFGVETVKQLWTPQIARRLRQLEMRENYDFAISILRGKPVSAPRWGSKNYKRVRNPFLPNRWYSVE